MKRSDAINAIRFAGYHGDKSTFTSLYIENRVSRSGAEKAFRDGQAAKKSGQRCGCMDCRDGAAMTGSVQR